MHHPQPWPACADPTPIPNVSHPRKTCAMCSDDSCRQHHYPEFAYPWTTHGTNATCAKQLATCCSHALVEAHTPQHRAPCPVRGYPLTTFIRSSPCNLLQDKMCCSWRIHRPRLPASQAAAPGPGPQPPSPSAAAPPRTPCGPPGPSPPISPARTPRCPQRTPQQSARRRP